MAEPLKNSFGADVPRTIARMIAAVSPRFDEKAFVRSALDGYDELELMPRAWKIAHVLRRYLPDDYERALEMLLASLDQQSKRRAASGMGAFLFLPHVFFVAEYGLDHFEASMRAQYVLTQRFTAEFSIRRYLERHQAATLARLAEWTADPSEDVRRLVSEGTRPRLPWAPRLRAFQADPRPVLALSDTLASLQAALLEKLPGQLMSRDNLASMQVDSVCNGPFPAAFGFQPAALEAIAPQYLARQTPRGRFDHYRARNAG